MPKRILVIDNDEDILEILRIIFQEEGYEVVMSNTAEAADHIHQISPNLIILDINLMDDDKNGAQVCKEFKSQYPHDNIPVILVSAENNLHLIASYCGADDYISKPFDINDLIKRVEQLIP